MTETEAIDAVLDWIFGKTKGKHNPARFKEACLITADRSRKNGGRWNRTRIHKERW